MKISQKHDVCIEKLYFFYDLTRASAVRKMVNLPVVNEEEEEKAKFN